LAKGSGLRSNVSDGVEEGYRARLLKAGFEEVGWLEEDGGGETRAQACYKVERWRGDK